MIVMMPIQHVRFYHLKLKTKTSQTNWENLCGWRGSMHLVCVMASVFFFFIIQIIIKNKKTDCVVVGSYFEIWVWNASILVRVLVISSNTFSCYTRTKILNPTFTREINNTPDPTEYQQLLTCTATPKLLPSSILGTWSCTHIDTCHKNWNLYISV